MTTVDEKTNGQLQDLSIRLRALEGLCWHLSNAHEEGDADDTSNLSKVFHHIAECLQREAEALDHIVMQNPA